MSSKGLQAQIDFIVEVDRLKNVFRQTSLIEEQEAYKKYSKIKNFS